jgi:ABC-type transporter Mla subunit MlaD
VLGTETQHLEARRDELVEEVRGRIEEDVKERVGAAVTAVEETLQALGESLHEAAEQAGTVCAAVETSLEALSEAMEPLPGGVEQVKQAAQKVNLDFA